MSELERIEGLFVGQLSEPEMCLFVQAVKDGRAYRVYEGTAGFLGLAKVKLVRVLWMERFACDDS